MMMVGYPIQTDAEIDAMYEKELADSFEKLNDLPEEAESFRDINEYGTDLRIHAAANINTAMFMLGLVMENLEDSMNTIHGTSQYDRMASMYDTISDLRTELRGIRREVWRPMEDE